MSSPLVCAQAALRPSVAFIPTSGAPLALKRFAAVPKLAGVAPASRLQVRPAPEMVSSGIREVDALTGGLPRGCLTEVCGPASSGRTSLLLSVLAAATRREEACALVDVSDAFDPLSAAAAGVDFARLLWVRCGVIQKKTNSPRRHRDTEEENPVEQALRVTDLLLQSGGFGLVAIDLGDIPQRTARRIPLTSWFRFQRAVENKPTMLLLVTQAPCAQTCASLLLRVRAQSSIAGRHSSATHAQLLDGLFVESELLRSRLERKPAGSVNTVFTTKTACAG